jgi:hypothetical protein
MTINYNPFIDNTLSSQLFSMLKRPIGLNGFYAEALISHTNINKYYDDIKITTLTPIKRGDLIIYDHAYWLVISEVVTTRHGKYKGLMRHVAYPLVLTVGNVTKNVFLIPQNDQSVQIDDSGTIVFVNGSMTIVTRDTDDSLFDIETKFNFLGKTWIVTYIDNSKKGLLALKVNNVAGDGQDDTYLPEPDIPKGTTTSTTTLPISTTTSTTTVAPSEPAITLSDDAEVSYLPQSIGWSPAFNSTGKISYDYDTATSQNHIKFTPPLSSSTPGSALFYREANSADGTFEFDVVSGADQQVRLYFRYGDESNQVGYSCSSSNQIHFRARETNKADVETVLSNKYFPSTYPFHVKMTFHDTNIQLYINDELIDNETSDYSLNNTKILLGTISKTTYDTPLVVDNIIVTSDLLTAYANNHPELGDVNDENNDNYFKDGIIGHYSNGSPVYGRKRIPYDELPS